MASIHVAACAGVVHETAPRPLEVASVRGVAPTSKPLDADYGALGGEVVRLVDAQFHDSVVASAWARTHRGYADGITQRDVFDRETVRILKALGTSHTTYFGLDDPRRAQLQSIFSHSFSKPEVESIGADYLEREGGWFVASAFVGGAAANAGIMRGDAILRSDGQPFHPGRAFVGRAGSRVRLEVQRAKSGPIMAFDVTPMRGDPKDEWLATQRRASRILERGGKRVAYAWLWSCAGEEHQQALEEFISDEASSADALVVDFRDGWGGCTPTFVNLFSAQVPELKSVGRSGAPERYRPAWRGPLVLLVNERSTSGKEVVAHTLKRFGRAQVVGQRTAGAVAMGRPTRLPDGSILYLAVARVEVDGETIEGRGVEPHIATLDSLAFAAGEDPQLETALDAAVKLAGRPRAQ